MLTALKSSNNPSSDSWQPWVSLVVRGRVKAGMEYTHQGTLEPCDPSVVEGNR
jgi:hypothetical protein